MKRLLIAILIFLLSTQLCAQSSTDIDVDDDGLIELHNLEMLDAMRYQLDGSAYATSTAAAKITTGCAIGGCKGYELVRDLDFMDDASYASTANKARWTVANYTESEAAGWQPIGTADEFFNAIFEGNGHTLSNLMINRPATDYVGLFYGIEGSAMLVNLALFNIHVQGRDFVGGLVVQNSGSIINSYVTGTVTGNHNVGGLVVQNSGRITNSYVAGMVTGNDSVGGLVGINQFFGAIVSNYTAGMVIGMANVGGLVAQNVLGHITNSYATGMVTGTNNVGGLVGRNVGAGSSRITNSYWDVQTSSIAISAGGTSKTTVELQSPTTATGIYSDWSTANWDFSSSSHHPLLKYAIGADTNNPACGVPTQPACGTLLPRQLPSLLTELLVANGTLSPPFDPRFLSYDVTVDFDTTHLELYATATGASLRVRSSTANAEVANTDVVELAMPLNLIDDTLISIEVVEDGRRPTVYRFTVSHLIAELTTPTVTVVVGDSRQTIDEGAAVVLRATIGSRFRCDFRLSCEWYYRDATSRARELADAQLSADSLQLNFTVPTDYVAAAQTTGRLVVLFTVSNLSGTASAETPFMIMKRDDGPIRAEAIGLPTLSDDILGIPDIDLADDPDGVNAALAPSYQWQRAKSGAVDLSDSASWEDIDAATATTYTLATTQFSPHRVRIRYTDAQAYDNTIYSRWIRDIDTDDDGLVEIHNLQMLDAMRHQLDGSGYRENASAAKMTAGCANSGCKGYELLRDLDFGEDRDWEPVGTDSKPFTAIFEGNAHTLSNLRINSLIPRPIGLFSRISNDSRIVNLGLLYVHIKGIQYVGSLVGRNQGHIVNSYAMGTIEGSVDVGGLVGQNENSITNSYVMGAITGAISKPDRAGGLVGSNRATITNSYAMATVIGTDEAGGLVGHFSLGRVANSYAVGSVAGSENVGGLVGRNVGGSITSSYWDVQARGVAVSAGGTSKTTTELQSPTTATGIYRDWSTADWDFSNPSHYPLLKYALWTDDDYAACGLSEQPACGTLLAEQFPIRSLLENLVVANGRLSPSFSPWLFAYDVSVAFDVSHLELRTAAAGASLRIRSDASDSEVHSTDTASAMILLRAEDDTMVYIELMKDGQIPKVYRLTVSYDIDDSVAKPSTPALVVDGAQTIDEGATVVLHVNDKYRCGTNLSCRWHYRDAASQAIELVNAELSSDLLQFSYTVPTAYVAADHASQQLVVVFTVRNPGGVASAEIPLVIVRRDDGPIDAKTLAVPILVGRVLIAPEIDLTNDPDGMNTNSRLSYQWQRAKSDAVDLSDDASWDEIEDAVGKTYNLPLSEDTQTISYRVRIHYVDSQGHENTIHSMPIEVRSEKTDLKVRLRVFLEAPV